MTWWTTVPGLTPIAAWDAGRVSATQILDGVGTNHITPTSDVRTYDFEYKSVYGNGNLMPFSTPITTPTTGVIAGFWHPRRRNVFVCGPAGSASAYLLHISDANLSWYASNGTANAIYGAYGAIAQRYFVCVVNRGTDSILYVDGVLVGGPVGISFVPASLGNVGYTANGNEYNLDADEKFHALGIWSGMATQADVQAIEAACRAELVGQPGTARYLPPLIGRRNSEPPQALFKPNAYALEKPLGRWDNWYGGAGKIVGTVFDAPNTPVERRVRLFDEKSGILVRQTWSNPATGAYIFENVQMSRRYTVIGYDHTGIYRGVIADSLYAEPMP